MSDPTIISSYARTPMGRFQGALSGFSAVELGSVAVKAAVERSGVDPQLIERIYLGCVLPAGLGQAPARQAALGAGGRSNDRQQDVWLRDASRDNGERGAGIGRGRYCRCGRYGEHGQRPLCAAQASLGRTHRP